MGYSDFESYGFDTLNKTYYGYSAPEFKTILEDLELSTYNRSLWTSWANGGFRKRPKKICRRLY